MKVRLGRLRNFINEKLVNAQEKFQEKRLVDKLQAAWGSDADAVIEALTALFKPVDTNWIDSVIPYFFTTSWDEGATALELGNGTLIMVMPDGNVLLSTQIRASGNANLISVDDEESPSMTADVHNYDDLVKLMNDHGVFQRRAEAWSQRVFAEWEQAKHNRTAGKVVRNFTVYYHDNETGKEFTMLFDEYTIPEMEKELKELEEMGLTIDRVDPPLLKSV